ncbi:hypothetical protein MASR1M12_34730 [Erysipelotrichia bacterium]
MQAGFFEGKESAVFDSLYGWVSLQPVRKAGRTNAIIDRGRAPDRSCIAGEIENTEVEPVAAATVMPSAIIF